MPQVKSLKGFYFTGDRELMRGIIDEKGAAI
jgi:hypothetical protein